MSRPDIHGIYLAMKNEHFLYVAKAQGTDSGTVLIIRNSKNSQCFEIDWPNSSELFIAYSGNMRKALQSVLKQILPSIKKEDLVIEFNTKKMIRFQLNMFYRTLEITNEDMKIFQQILDLFFQ